MALLEAAGIEVVIGICEAEARALNKRFFTFHENKRPYVILKWAQSIDGFIAPVKGRKVMLSNALAQRYVHKMRQEEAAILVGYNTALLDNPILSDRFFGGSQPLRIVLDMQNNLPDNLLLKTDGGKTLVFNSKIEQQTGNCHYVKLQSETDTIKQILDYLYKIGINSLIVEGGSKTFETFIESGFWDEAHIINTPVFIEKGTAAPNLKNALQVKSIVLADNTVQVLKRN